MRRSARRQRAIEQTGLPGTGVFGTIRGQRASRALYRPCAIRFEGGTAAWAWRANEAREELRDESTISANGNSAERKVTMLNATKAKVVGSHASIAGFLASIGLHSSSPARAVYTARPNNQNRQEEPDHPISLRDSPSSSTNEVFGT